jgi:hypothetical protein
LQPPPARTWAPFDLEFITPSVSFARNLKGTNMSQHDFSNELLGQTAAAPATDPARILDRERRRMRIAAALVIGLWLFATFILLTVLLPMWAKVNFLQQLENKSAAPTTMLAPVGGAPHLTANQILRALATISTAISVVVTLASLLAAIATVWLVFTVRRITLRQISVALAQISEQLRQMQHKPS